MEHMDGIDMSWAAVWEGYGMVWYGISDDSCESGRRAGDDGRRSAGRGPGPGRGPGSGTFRVFLRGRSIIACCRYEMRRARWKD